MSRVDQKYHKADLADIETLAPALEMTLNGPVSVLNRMRLACTPLSEGGEVLACAEPGEFSAKTSFAKLELIM